MGFSQVGEELVEAVAVCLAVALVLGLALGQELMLSSGLGPGLAWVLDLQVLLLAGGLEFEELTILPVS